MKDRSLLWVLVALLAIVSAGLLYVLTRGDREAVPKPSERAAAAPGPAAPAARFTRAAQTGDPNGFANIRSGPSVEHPIVGRVESGETFTTFPQTGDWWEVRSADGLTGYMAREWIRMIGQETAAAPVAGPVAVAAEPSKPVSDRPVPATVPAGRADAGLICPDSDRRLLGRGDIVGLSGAEIRIARNEIYARRGRIFEDVGLSRHFRQFDWYRPLYREVGLNRIETANVAFLQRAEAGK